MNEQVEAVRRMQKFIDGHLNEVITPADLATVSMFSPWHARRVFLQHTRMSPARYIRILRLSRSAFVAGRTKRYFSLSRKNARNRCDCRRNASLD